MQIKFDIIGNLPPSPLGALLFHLYIKDVVSVARTSTTHLNLFKRVLEDKSVQVPEALKMLIKFDIMGNLPTTLLNVTTKQLSIKDVVSVARTSTVHLNLFKPIVALPMLLHHVTRCNHEAVKAMLGQDMSLFYRKGQVTDCSLRTFKNISGFEYALWALDKHMWTTILECVPQDEEGNKVLKLLQGQYDHLNTSGITYSFNEQIITEKHFSFENTIIKELQTQLDSIKAHGAKNWDAIEKHWVEGVGGAQKKLPMHSVLEYCSNEPFYPTPKFISQPKSMYISKPKKFLNWGTNNREYWFSEDSKFGTEFAIHKANAYGAMRGGEGVEPACRADLDAMMALSKVRTLDFINLKSQLEAQAIWDNHHQVVPQ